MRKSITYLRTRKSLQWIRNSAAAGKYLSDIFRINTYTHTNTSDICILNRRGLSSPLYKKKQKYKDSAVFYPNL